MIRQRLTLTALFIAILSIVVASGDAEARNRCRQGLRSNGGWGRQQTNYNAGYSNNSGGSYYGTSNAYGTNLNAPTTPGMVNGTVLQPDGTYSAGKPSYADPNQPATQLQPGTQQLAPAPAPNTLPNDQRINNRVPNTPNNNPSPDADNSARNLTTSPIPGAQPAKAPAPAAAAVPEPR